QVAETMAQAGIVAGTDEHNRGAVHVLSRVEQRLDPLERFHLADEEKVTAVTAWRQHWIGRDEIRHVSHGIGWPPVLQQLPRQEAAGRQKILDFAPQSASP